LPPVVSNKYGPLGWVPTLTLTTHIRQLPKTEVLLLDFVARDIQNGYFEQDCTIWDLDGNLVASSRQLTRILKSEDKITI
jgi:acyl-CoA thioesterase